MNLHEALNCIHFTKRSYFQYKFPDIRFDQTLPIRTEQEFLSYVNRSTMNSFLRWEKTPEYKSLVALYLDSKIANDLEQIYNVVKDKAIKGDEKAVKLFMALAKEISTTAKQAESIFTQDEEPEEDDDLVV